MLITMLDVSRSLAAAKMIQVEKKACYKNALLTFLSRDEFRAGWYVEGFAIPDIKGVKIPFEHGWVELFDGSVIDVTFADLGHASVTYFPAIKLSFHQALNLV